MKCPRCNKSTQVLDSRPDGQSVNRRRQCKVCGHRFTTAETIVADATPAKPKPKAAPKQKPKQEKKEYQPGQPTRPRHHDLDDIWDDLSSAGDGISLKELGLD